VIGAARPNSLRCLSSSASSDVHDIQIRLGARDGEEGFRLEVRADEEGGAMAEPGAVWAVD
jgi:hypothetical protein